MTRHRTAKDALQYPARAAVAINKREHIVGVLRASYHEANDSWSVSIVGTAGTIAIYDSDMQCVKFTLTRVWSLDELDRLKELCGRCDKSRN